jgi:putative membrane protein
MSSELALERAESQEVQDFAQQMIDAHTATTEQLTPIAEALEVAPPSEPNAMQQLMIAHLGTLEGAAFDTTYLEHQVLAHEAAVASYVTASDLVQDQALQDFVAQNLPAIQEHLQMAQQMMAQGTMTGGGN